MPQQSETGILTRDILRTECEWLDTPLLHKGLVVYRYNDRTYGCISENGVAVTYEGSKGFCEVPRDAVLWSGQKPLEVA